MKYKKQLKKENAITLIALVITIIVLLILAGVTIATLTGDNGILTRTNEAKQKTEEAEKEELRKLTQMEAKTNLENKEYIDNNGDRVMIPAGFAVSQVKGENVIDDGLVIIDNEGSEFVWIPVEDINDMAKLTDGTDSNGNLNYQGILYDFPSAYESKEKIDYGQETTSYREPDLVSYDRDTENNYLNIINEILGSTYSSSDTNKFLVDMQKDYNAMVKSVGKYHGFYISRYEMSKSSTTNKVVSVANVPPLTGAISSANRWYGLYAYGKTYNTDSVASSMIWGSQYDAMLRWLQRGVNKINVNGNIGDNRNTTQITGNTSTDIIKNIYDLYGCLVEMTLEVNNSENRVYRGGIFYSNLAPSIRHNGSSDYASSLITSRFTLYIK